MKSKQNIAYLVSGILIGFLISGFGYVIAEQSSVPDSGATSRISQLYEELSSNGYGSDSSGNWGDLGSAWNRIWSAATWVPSNSLTADNVAQGETFYSGSRTEQAGTASLAMDYSTLQFVDYDDYEGTTAGDIDGTYPVDDYSGEESVWTNTSVGVWKDERSGLFWSGDLGTRSNIFPNQNHTACDFFNSELYPTRGQYPGSDSDCGLAINLCGNLELDADGDGNDDTQWYLPTYKELMTAFIDGMYNQTDPSFATYSWFWTSTELSYSNSRAWASDIATFEINTASKSSVDYHVRCVLRMGSTE